MLMGEAGIATIVCYHYPCHDGAFAALAAYLHFARTHEAVRFVCNRVYAPSTVTDLQLQVYFGCTLVYCLSVLSGSGTAIAPRGASAAGRPGERRAVCMQGHETVYLLDYAGPSGFAAAVAQAVPSGRVHLLDHHKSAAEQLQGAALPRNLHITLDQRRSGAQIALEHFQPQVGHTDSSDRTAGESGKTDALYKKWDCEHGCGTCQSVAMTCRGVWNGMAWHGEQLETGMR